VAAVGTTPEHIAALGPQLASDLSQERMKKKFEELLD